MSGATKGSQLLNRALDGPSYWGNEEDGRELRTYIRNDQYTIQWSKRSRLEIFAGQELKDKYELGYHERLRLEVRNDPK